MELARVANEPDGVGAAADAAPAARLKELDAALIAFRMGNMVWISIYVFSGPDTRGAGWSPAFRYSAAQMRAG